MAIKVNDGFQLGSSVAVDSRLVLTSEEMANMNDAIMPDTYMAVSKTDGSLYLYNKVNDKNVTTGRFRKFEGGDDITYFSSKAAWEAAKAAGTLDSNKYYSYPEIDSPAYETEMKVEYEDGTTKTYIIYCKEG